MKKTYGNTMAAFKPVHKLGVNFKEFHLSNVEQRCRAQKCNGRRGPQGVLITLMKETGNNDGKSGKAGLSGRISI